MEIRRVLRGESTGFAASRPARGAEDKRTDTPSTDRLELSRQWVETMEEQRAQSQAVLSGTDVKKSNGILDMLDRAGDRSEELNALSEQLKVQQRCAEIARRMMAGKRVPPKDERYLMENDPEGYKLVVAMRKPPKKDEKECESLLEDEEGGKTTGTQESAPAEGGSETE